jgi:hypothetical protein
MATKNLPSKRESKKQNDNNEGSISGIKKQIFLETGIACLLFSLTQLGEAKKAYLKEGEYYKFFMSLFITSISISCLLLGIYLGVKMTESKINRKNPSL